MGRKIFRGVAEAVADKNNPAVADVAHNFSGETSREKNAMVFRVLRILSALGISRFSASAYRPSFTTAAEPKAPSPKPK